MKTVMKKMFCLMLVAVLMVGVMPFQASASAGTVEVTFDLPGDADIHIPSHPCSSAEGVLPEALLNKYVADWESLYNVGQIQYLTAGGTGTPSSGSIGTRIPIGTTIAIFLGAKPAATTCPTCGQDPCVCCPTCGKAPSACDCCDSCGAANGATHASGCPNAPQPATYTLTLELKIGETSNDIAATKSKSGLNGTIDLKAISEELFPSYAFMWTSLGKDVTTMEITENTTLKVRMAAPVVTSTCPTCGETYSGTTHTCPQCSFSGCVLTKNHSGEHQCACGMYPQKGSGHNTSCTYYEANNKTYSLKVWAKLWVGNSLNKTILLDEFADLDGTEVVPYIIGNNVSRLESKFPSGYNNIEWTKAVYYYIDSNTTGTVDTNMNVNEEDNVYINLYSQEKLFVVNVHLGKYYGIDSTVKVGGFRVGETVSYDDVLKAVKKQYNVSSLKMYTYDNWCKVVEGKTSSTSPYFQVHDGDNVYEVYVSGSRKTTSASSSSSATADSSNPKTGDMIFAPVAVMGLSVSALAVLFFLNKKRAY